MKEDKISLFDVLNMFEEKKTEGIKYPKQITVEDALERMLVVLHRNNQRIERIEKITRLMAETIENLRVTTEIIARKSDESDYKTLFIANYGKRRDSTN